MTLHDISLRPIGETPCRSQDVAVPQVRRSKRERLAAWASRIGLTRAVEMLPKRQTLIVLNYHRIGDSTSGFDPGAFSATVDEFDWQVAWLKSRFAMLTLDEAMGWLASPNDSRPAGVLITFDDGYLDNYRLAFPVLRAHEVSATFFLVTSFVGTNRVPWWDRLAHALLRTEKRRIRFDDPAGSIDIDMQSTPRPKALQSVLAAYKSRPVDGANRLLAGVEQACEVRLPALSRMFLDWQEAAEMLAGGMSLASHTHSHQVLSRMPFEEQLGELRTSRSILESRLGIRVDALAYPVGGRGAFSSDTVRALGEAGYRAAFSYYGGVNQPARTDRFDIRRLAVGTDATRQLLRLRLALAGCTGRALI